MGFIALTRIWTKDLICCLYWNDNASFTNIFYNLLWINEDFSAEGLITNKVISGCLCLGIDVCIYMMESFFSEIFLRFAWCKIQHAPVPSLLRGILLVLQIWVRTRVVWETASLILDSFLFSTAHFDSIWISCLPCGWCIEVQCLIWVKFGSALLNWQETLLFFFFWWRGKGGGSVFCWFCVLKWLSSGRCQGQLREMGRKVNLWHLAVGSACFAALPQSEQFENKQ